MWKHKPDPSVSIPRQGNYSMFRAHQADLAVNVLCAPPVPSCIPHTLTGVFPTGT